MVLANAGIQVGFACGCITQGQARGELFERVGLTVAQGVSIDAGSKADGHPFVHDSFAQLYKSTIFKEIYFVDTVDDHGWLNDGTCCIFDRFSVNIEIAVVKVNILRTGAITEFYPIDGCTGIESELVLSFSTVGHQGSGGIAGVVVVFVFVGLVVQGIPA